MNTTTFVKIKTILIENGYHIMDGYRKNGNITVSTFRNDIEDVIITEVEHKDGL